MPAGKILPLYREKRKKGWQMPAFFLSEKVFICARRPVDKQRASAKKRTLNQCLTSAFLVGVAGLEPTASWSRTKHATKLRYTPG